MKTELTGEDLAAMVQELADAAADSLRAGEHEGDCRMDLSIMPGGGCVKHLTATCRRHLRLRAACEALGVENLPEIQGYYPTPILQAALAEWGGK